MAKMGEWLPNQSMQTYMDLNIMRLNKSINTIYVCESRVETFRVGEWRGYVRAYEMYKL